MDQNINGAGNSSTFRYQALTENQLQSNNPGNENSPQIIFHGLSDSPLHANIHSHPKCWHKLASNLRQIIIITLLGIIFGFYLFDSNVNFDRKSAQLFRSGLCSTTPATKFTSKYAVVFDAGSTGSRVHVYEFQFCGTTLLHLVDEIFEQVKPGLSSFSQNPHDAVESLGPLMRQAWRRVPRNMRRCTPIVLKATAGLRLLPQEAVDGILDRVRSWLNRQKFHMSGGQGAYDSDPVSVIDGSEEAVSAWISVNFLQGKIGPIRGSNFALSDQTPPTTSALTSVVLEMGGGSSQIVFDQKQTISKDLPGSVVDLNFFGRNFQLYQHSYLGYGIMEARKKLKTTFEIENRNAADAPFPCYPKGHTETLKSGAKLAGSSAGWDACADYVKKTLFDKKATCTKEPCSFNGVHQPNIPEGASIYALSYIYDRAMELGLKAEGYTLGEMHTRGKKVCEDGHEGNSVYKKNPHFCMDLVFIHSLLSHGYGIPEDRKIQSGFQINNYETGWTLGSALAVVETAPTFCSR